MAMKRGCRPQQITNTRESREQTEPISSSVPVKSPLAEFLHLSGSLQSVDAIIEDALLEDEGGDVDAQLICGSLVGGKLAFQPFETYEDEKSERRKDDRGGRFGTTGWLREEEEDEKSEDIKHGEELSSVSSSSETEETTASISLNDDPKPVFDKIIESSGNASSSPAISSSSPAKSVSSPATSITTDSTTPQADCDQRTMEQSDLTTDGKSRVGVAASVDSVSTADAAAVNDSRSQSTTHTVEKTSPLRTKKKTSDAPTKPFFASRLPEPLNFEIVDARIFREGPANRRFVLYTIVVKKTSMSKTDTSATPGNRAITLEKRFSDFDQLHRSLRRCVPSSVSAISIPPKRLFKNLDARTIAERSRAFEQYLSQISLDVSVRKSPPFIHFFYGVDLIAALDCLQRRSFVNALPALHRCLDVAALVVGGAHRHVFLGLCALAAVYNELEEDTAARNNAEAAVQWLQACHGWNIGEGDEIKTTTKATTSVTAKEASIVAIGTATTTATNHEATGTAIATETTTATALSTQALTTTLSTERVTKELSNTTSTSKTVSTATSTEISPWERRRRGKDIPRDEIDDYSSSSSSSSASSSSGYQSASVFHLGYTYNILTTPLIELTIRLRWKSGIDKRELENILDNIQKDPSFVKERKRTLLHAVSCLRPEV